MILIAVLAPVIIAAVLITGAATLAVLVTGVAAVGGLVVGCSERAAYSLSRRRWARRLATGATSMEWPQPTSQPEYAYCLDLHAEPGTIDEDEEVPLTVEVEDPVLVSITACAAAHAAHSSRVSSWEEVFPAYVPDFEEPDAYTLVAGTADRQ